ncbi:flagellar assembly protein FliH [Halomonas ventosae]|uniref:Flagellar assembly protein FliH n=1 Tax=Halomonas ventosae TaxID=229007 RepID=A0A4R6ZTJ8_9GAMM|nr:flagellar assembly protein FliH [Halomonas ventosae]TDR56113.1 flagellar assembly protein FliH [Halomonas ventosae]
MSERAHGSAWRRWEMEALSLPERRRAQAEAEIQARDAARQAQADEHLRQARERALAEEQEQARRAGYEAGFAQGQEEGHREGMAQGLAEARETAHKELERELREALSPVADLADSFRQALARLDEEVANRLVTLALTVGRKLAGEALQASPEQVLESVRALLHAEPEPLGHPRLWLHPEDLGLVEEVLGAELEAAGWTLQPDDAISRGGCRVTSRSGELDATLETRWESIRAQVRGRSSAVNTSNGAGDERG